MKLTKTTLYMAIITATVGIAACSDSSSSSDVLKTSIGRITGFGSVFVGGVEYETDTATITKDGQPAINGDDDLKVGMIVTVKGTASGNQGVARSIEFTDELEGIVQDNNLLNPDGTANPDGNLTVMGQTVTTDANTNLESNDPGITTPGDIPAGAIVEISGYNDGAGNILASYIELKARDIAVYDGEMEVKGIVTGLSDTVDTLTFELGKVTVDATAIRDTIDLGVPLANDLYVEVKSRDGFDQNTGYLLASKIELEEDGDYDHDGAHGDEVEVEGILTAINLENGAIEVDGRSIRLPEGMNIAGHTVGDLIEVEFRIDEEGNAVAYKMEKEDAHDDDEDFSIRSIVTAIDPDNATITVDGKTIHVDRYNAIMIDHGDKPEKYFSISSLAVGDLVEVEVYLNKDGNYIAIKVEREND